MADPTESSVQQAIDTIRTLSMDAVQAANSGHPGTPIALAPAAYLLMNEAMNYDPAQPGWPNRDRFVLSCGHASTLLYSMLHLAGVKQLDANGQPTDEAAVPLAHLRQFRQLDSRCPGHPEFGHTSGVETTTGPLGQGIANSVGMAIASRWLGARFNRPGFELFDFDAYALCSDGDIMEGVGAEAASIAGHLKLSNLCWIYDDNKITIEGKTSLSFSEDVARRFEGYGFQVVKVDDINDLAAMRAALKQFRQTDDRPTLIVVRSVIAWGAPNAANTHGAHGAPLGEDEIRLTKAAYGWPEDEHFRVPDEVPALFADGVGARGKQAREAWDAMLAQYRTKHADEAAQLDTIARGELPEGWDADIKEFPADAKGIASRASSGKVLNQVGKNIPWMLGGSADLSPSNKSTLNFDTAGEFSAESYAGRNFHFGIREHAMASICNGMALSGLRAYGATFFVFTDYMRPPMRLAALMKLPVFYIFTHDSIGVGEDGPTHQPVEHLAALRAIPGLNVFRPADANEVAESYRAILRRDDGPSAIVLTRQNLPTLDRTEYAPAAGLQKGGYVLADICDFESDGDGKPDVILIATGSEVSLCVEARQQLAAEGIKARVVSLPCWELFDAQPAEYRNSVLPPEVTARVGVEAGIELGWSKYVGAAGRFIGMDGYGASAPSAVLMKQFGFTVENVVAAAKSVTG
ncbi:MAG: transketolase [Candidatus Nealsonbacteria bacterium]|nr:transketolase [Candidatus Nealsonbacteria bacterium]